MVRASGPVTPVCRSKSRGVLAPVETSCSNTDPKSSAQYRCCDAVDTTTSRHGTRPTRGTSPSGPTGRFSEPLVFVHAVVPAGRSMRDTAPLPNVIRYRPPSSDEPRRSPYSVLHFEPGNVVSTLSCPSAAPVGSIVSTSPSGTPTQSVLSVSKRTDAVWAGIDHRSGGGKSADPTIEPSAVAKTSTLPVAPPAIANRAPSALKLASPKAAIEPTGRVGSVLGANGTVTGGATGSPDVTS